MTREEFKTVEPLFHQALELPPGVERERFVRDRCPALLAAFLRILLEADAAQPEPAADTEAPLPRCGPYQADNLLGTGGMGVVYRATRGDGEFQQTVALKVLRSVAHTESARQRFRAERQILAQLQHPHIAALHDGGVSAEGEPYLAMEYVDGEPLDRYCDRHRLSIAARLTLFRQVLDAVEYAHRNLIVHGDLKPSNILVTADGSTKLLDFGTSRFLDEETYTTLASAMTPKFASPEQLRGERLATTSDVFSLGLVLYELLTGAPAFPSGTTLMSVMARAMEETNPTDPGAAITEAAAAARGCSIGQLREAVRGDLASIVHKALAHDPERRYQSVAEFAADIERFQSGLPVLARRQTLLYRAGKFASRNRLPVAAALLVTVGLAALAGYAYRQQRQALAHLRRAQVTNRFLTRLFTSINPLYGGHWNMTAAELVEKSAPRAETMLGNEPAALAEFQITIAGNLLFIHGPASAIAMAERAAANARRSDDVGMQALTLAFLGWEQSMAGQCQAALHNVAAAFELANSHSQKLTREWKIFVATGGSQATEFCGGDLKAVRPYILEAVKLARQIPDNSMEEDTPPLVTKTMATETAGEVLGCDEGRPFRQETLAMVRKDEELRNTEGLMLYNEARCLVKSGRLAEAIPMLRRCLELWTAVFGPHSSNAQLVHAALAYTLAQSGESRQAIQEARAAVTNLDHSSPAVALYVPQTAAQALIAAGDFKDAVPLARELVSQPTVRLTGQMCLFVAYAEDGQCTAAKPYRAAAEKAVAGVPAGSPLRIRIEDTLRRCR
jgi:tetratricopeptide (TPR) repeat protein/predicted Ser/Thr protein kinase